MHQVNCVEPHYFNASSFGRNYVLQPKAKKNTKSWMLPVSPTQNLGSAYHIRFRTPGWSAKVMHARNTKTFYLYFVSQA